MQRFLCKVVCLQCVGGLNDPVTNTGGGRGVVGTAPSMLHATVPPSALSLPVPHGSIRGVRAGGCGALQLRGPQEQLADALDKAFEPERTLILIVTRPDPEP